MHHTPLLTFSSESGSVYVYRDVPQSVTDSMSHLSLLIPDRETPGRSLSVTCRSVSCVILYTHGFMFLRRISSTEDLPRTSYLSSNDRPFRPSFPLLRSFLFVVYVLLTPRPLIPRRRVPPDSASTPPSLLPRDSGPCIDPRGCPFPTLRS